MTRRPRASALLACAVVLLGAVASVPGQPTGAEVSAAAAAPWWPDLQPQQHAQGWTLRVPVRIGDPVQATPAGSLVQVHLDMAFLLKDTPWPATTSGGQRLLKSFHLDPDSVRVVKYTTNWAQPDPEEAIPAVVHEGWLVRDQSARYLRVQAQPFDAARVPLLTVEWPLDASLAAGAKQYVMVLLDIVENGASHAAPTATPRQQGRLDSQYWVGPGSRLYGYFPGAPTNAPTLTIVAPFGQATVEVLSHRGGERPSPDTTPGQTNPFTVPAGGLAQYSLGTQATHFVVASDQPVVVMEQSGTQGAFAPGVHGSYYDNEFLVPRKGGYMVAWVPPEGDGTTICIGGASCGPVAPGGFHRLPISDPTSPAPLHVTSSNAGGPGKDFFLQYSMGHFTSPRLHVPTTTGAPMGTDFVTTMSNGRGVEVLLLADGEAQLSTPWDGKSVGDPVQAQANQPVVRPVSGGRNDPLFLPGDAQTKPLLITTSQTALVNVGKFDAGGHHAFTPFGGVHGMEWVLRGSVGVHGLYDGTTATLTTPTGPQTLGLDRDVVRTVTRTDDAPYTMVSDKPVVVVPIVANAADRQAFLAGVPPLARVEILPAAYRSFVVDLRHAAGDDPAFFNAVPGGELQIPLKVQNLGLWNGAPTPDSVRLTVAAPAAAAGWVNLPSSQFVLPDHGTKDVVATVRVPADTEPGTTLTLKFTATSENNPRMKADVTAVVHARAVFGVGAWWGDDARDTGVRQRTDVRMAPDTTTPFPFRIQNTGSGIDDIRLDLHQPGADWEAQITRPNGAPLQPAADGSVLLSGIASGEAVPLELLLRSGAGDQDPSAIAIDATSIGSPAKKVRLTLVPQISLGQDLELRIGSVAHTITPGGVATIPATVVNTGGDLVRVSLRLDHALPAGWSATLQAATEPVSVRPGESLPVSVRIQAPADAKAHAFASVLLSATGDGGGAHDAVSLSVSVEPVAGLALSAPATVSAPLEGPVAVPVTVTQQGNGPARVHLQPSGLPPGWTVDVGQAVNLQAGASATVQATVRVPEGTLAGDHPWHIQASADDGGFAQATTVLAVGQLSQTAWEPVADLRLRPDGPWSRTVVVHNQGNHPQAFAFDVLAPPGWDAAWRPKQATVEPGQSASILVEGTVPDLPGGPYPFQVVASSSSGSSQTGFVVRIEHPVFRLEEIVHQEVPATHGDVGYVLARFGNPTNVSLEQASVRMLVGGEVVDEVTFARVGPATDVLAALQWSASSQAPRIEWVVAGQTVGHMDLAPSSPPVSQKSVPFGLVGCIAALFLARRWTR